MEMEMGMEMGRKRGSEHNLWLVLNDEVIQLQKQLALCRGIQFCQPTHKSKVVEQLGAMPAQRCVYAMRCDALKH